MASKKKGKKTTKRAGGKRPVQRIVTTTRTERAVFAGLNGIETVAGIGGGVFAVGAIGAVAWYFWPRPSSSGFIPPPPTGDPIADALAAEQARIKAEADAAKKAAKAAEQIAKDAANADIAFAASTVAAGATASATVTGSAPYVGAATPVVVGAWRGLSTEDKANVWRGKPTGGKGAATGAATTPYTPPATNARTDASATPAQQGRSGDTTFAGLFGFSGFGAAPSGGAGVLKWAVDMFIKVLKQKIRELGAVFCANADRVYAKLEAAGAKVPKKSKWDALSCDQKIAFIVALGPLGIQMLLAGALVGGWVSDAPGQFKKYGEAAAKSLGSAASSFANATKDAVNNVVSSAGIKF